MNVATFATTTAQVNREMTGMEAETKRTMLQRKVRIPFRKPTDAATAASNGEEPMDDMNEETETMEENSKRAKV